MDDLNICCVFVCNSKYINNFFKTYNQLITNGNYNGDICLVIGNDLKDSQFINDIINNTKIIVKYFPDIVFSDYFYEINRNMKIEGYDYRNIHKVFQWHKLHVFNTFFKKWDYIFYIDCGITILNDIKHIINERREMKLIAHSDAYDEYEQTLKCQFDHSNKLFQDLYKEFNLEIDYFQTTIMLIDTNIILDNTFNELVELANKYPICRTNEQGIMAVYFTNIKNYYKPISIYNDSLHLYDYYQRNKNASYVMYKY